MQIIDALIVTLGLDPSNFQAGKKKVDDGLKDTGDKAEVNRKRHEAEAKKVGEAYAKIRNEVLALTAALVGAVAGKQFLENLTRSDAAVGKLATNLGMATDELSAWEGVAKRFGGTAEDMDGAFRGVTKILEDIKNTGGSEALTPLQKVGLDLAKFSDKATTGTQRMLMLSDALKKLSPQDAQYFGAQAGFSETTINLMMRGGALLTDDLKLQREIGVATRESAAAAAELQAKWEEVFQRVTGVGREIAVSLYPAIKAVLTVITDFLALAKQNMPITQGAVLALTAAFVALTALKFAGIIRSIAAMTGGLGAAGAAATGVLGVLARLSGVAAAGAAGWAIGTAINSQLSDDTKNTIGRTIAKGMAALGSSDAQAALDAEARGAAPAPASVRNPSAPRNAANLPRGIRNNNPGNLNFAGQRGASKEGGAGGRFAVFGSMAEGIAALADQLSLYASRGIDSVRAIISKYAPAGENNTEAYIKAIMKRLGVSADQKLDVGNMGVLRELIGGISTVEVGAGRVSVDQINNGLALAQNRRAGGRSSTSTSETHIGQITVNTQATDARGIARDIAPAMRSQVIAANADHGIE